MNKKMIEQELQTVKGLQSVAEDAVEIKRFFYFKYFVERAVNILNKPTGLLTGFQPLHTQISVKGISND